MVKAVKLADIAEKLNVSVVTVSKALSGQKGVSDELRARIQKVAGEMGYRPVSAARRQERSRMLKSIGVLIHEKYLAEYTTFYWKCIRSWLWWLQTRTAWPLWKS